MSSERFTGRVEKGRVVFDRPERWEAAKAKLDGKRINVSIGAHHGTRSLAQNGLWWGQVIDEFMDFTGYEKYEAHALIKAMFVPEKERTLPSGEVVKVRSTALLTTKEMAEVYDVIVRWFAGHGVNLPPPGER